MLASGDGSGSSADRLSPWRDPATVVTGVLLLAVSALAWVEVARQAGAMTMQTMPTPSSSPDMAMGTSPALFPVAGALVFLAAWGVMMAAMMLPSATPMIALYAGMHRNAGRGGNSVVLTILFALVYVGVWLAAGVPVYLANLGVDAAARSNTTVGSLLPYGVALSLVAAGVYQFTPLKLVCLRFCQHPFMFLLGHWRTGYVGTLRTALDHAWYCLLCCSALMVVLVVAGAMALQWMLLISAVVFAEKLLPRGEWTARLSMSAWRTSLTGGRYGNFPGHPQMAPPGRFLRQL
jgi:predicted metal-binding membrane protein